MLFRRPVNCFAKFIIYFQSTNFSLSSSGIAICFTPIEV